jgi:putative nucleotide binding protein
MEPTPAAPTAAITKKEDYGLVLDYLPIGNAVEARKEPIIQVVGEHYFTLLEIVTTPGKAFSPLERVYIGKGERQGIAQIRGRINYSKLTSSGQRELDRAVKQIIKAREPEFVHFLNKAGSINIRAHSLELLPGVGKKYLEEILRQREQKPFESFADVAARVSHLGDPTDIFASRIVNELKGEEKYYMFAKAPAEEREDRGYGSRDGYRGGDRGNYYGSRDRPSYGSGGYRR